MLSLEAGAGEPGAGEASLDLSSIRFPRSLLFLVVLKSLAFAFSWAVFPTDLIRSDCPEAIENKKQPIIASRSAFIILVLYQYESLEDNSENPLRPLYLSVYSIHFYLTQSSEERKALNKDLTILTHDLVIIKSNVIKDIEITVQNLWIFRFSV